MTTEEKQLLLERSEEAVIDSMKSSGIYLLEKSIGGFEDSSMRELLLSVSNMQVAMELLLKTYICRTYGFASILTLRVRRLREANHTAYLKELKGGQIKTLGFDELKAFLKESEDTFAPVIEKGSCPCFGIEYDYLEGSFARFQAARNAFFHLGIESSDVDAGWLSTDFFCLLIIFISLLLREIDASEYNSDGDSPYRPSIEGDEMAINLWSTPMDILGMHLSSETMRRLRDNRRFMADLCDFAMDAYDSDVYVCTSCGAEAMFLDVYDGFSKCVSCGECFTASYTDCAVCGSENSVIYDGLNIDINQNILPGYCCKCRKHPKVYRCPTCGLAYSYSHFGRPKSFFFDCCEEHFQDRRYVDFEDC